MNDDDMDPPNGPAIPILTTVKVRVPHPVDFLLIGGKTPGGFMLVDIVGMTDEDLREIGKQWGELLVRHAASRRLHVWGRG